MKEKYWVRVDKRMAPNQGKLMEVFEEYLDPESLKIKGIRELENHWRVDVVKIRKRKTAMAS